MIQNDSSDDICFRLTFEVLDKHLAVALKGEPQWEDSTSPLVVSFSNTEGNNKPDRTFIHGTIWRDVPKNERAAFDALEQKQDSSDIAAEAAKLPPTYREVHDQLYAVVLRWADLARWRLALSAGPQRALGFTALEVSDDGTNWRRVPNLIRLKLSFGPVFGTKDPLVPAIAKLWQSGVTEPVSRAMFREAWCIKGSNPRSALVIGYASVEVGCKEFIGKIVPYAKWLAMESPSPPLPTILKNYLPGLPSPVKVVIPDSIRKAVQAGMESRNKLAHSGSLPLSSQELESLLKSFNDLLWLLDFCSGQEWARNYISYDVRIRLDT